MEIKKLFGMLVLVQAAHSLEEYFGRLWESFPPARFLTGLVSNNLEFGFVVVNVSLFVFGVWCFFWPIRRGWPVAKTFAWIWVIIELLNGVVHPAWSFMERGYTPGVATAPILLVFSLMLMWVLLSHNGIDDES